MWLILLDASGSMADPFSGSANFTGRRRATDAEVKIDAAKDAILTHLRSLGQSTEVAIFAFNVTARLIFQGSSADEDGIRSALAEVIPRGPTDIASALATASAAIDTHADGFLSRILLISDGLSDIATAAEVAADLHRRRVPIDAILIDLTENGIELVRRVVGATGSITGVGSGAEIETAVGKARDVVRSDVAAAQVAEDNLVAARAGMARSSPAEEVSFTVASPGELDRDSWASLLVYVHLASLKELVRSEALMAGRLKGADIVSPEVASTRLPRGAELLLTPRIPGFEVNPGSVLLTWTEDVTKAEFRIRPTTAELGPVLGEVEVKFEGLPIARIPLSIQVRASGGPRPGDSEPRLTTGAVFGTIFASYARTDLPVVETCAKIYAGLGIYVIIDTEALIGGQVWPTAIKALMRKSDAFQLFWSPASSVSDNVREEILDALAVQGDRGVGFIRPTYWEEPPPPLPANLAHLNFAYLDLGALGKPAPGGAVAPAPGRDAPLAGAPRIPVTVLPLLPGSSAAINREIAADAAFAVGFIERTLAARYYPVPTLLVDRYTVRAVRRIETVDPDLVNPTRQRKLADLGALLGAVCLDLHVSAFWGDGGDADRSAAAAGLSSEAFGALRRYCEGAPGSWLTPSWYRSSLDLADCATVREAAAKAVACAEAADIEGAAALRVQAYTLQEPWDVWRESLEPLGLALVGRSLDADLHGTAGAFKAGLALLWAKLAPALDLYADRFAERPSPPDGFEAALKLADAHCRALLDDPSDWFGGLDFVRRELEPGSGWQAVHAVLLDAGLPGLRASQTFPEFGDAFFGAVAAVLNARGAEVGERQHSGRYAVEKAIWDRLAAAGLPQVLTVTPARESVFRDAEAEVLMNGPIRAFADVVEWAWTQARLLLPPARSQSASQAVAVDAATYGIFAPARASEVDAQLFGKARDWGISPSLLLPGTDRVLLCSDALDDFRAALTPSGAKPSLARLLLRKILVHEHFHAYAATAPDDGGHPPAGPGFEARWREAAPVNEALAAWMEVHMARDIPDLSKAVWAYVEQGDYPDWPYAGASAVERLYQRQGLEGVRALVRILRSDPPAAIACLEREMARTSDRHAGNATLAKVVARWRTLIAGDGPRA